MSFFSRSSCALGTLAAVLVVSSACGEGERPCTPESEGYGDAKGLLWSSLLEVERTEGPCRPRVELYATGAELRRATEELKIEEVPFVDFAREKVIVREAPTERGLVWMAQRGDKITLGTQACGGNDPIGCNVHFYKVTSSDSAAADERACAPLSCAGVQPDPSGGGL